RRAKPRLSRANGVGRVIVDEGSQLVRRIAKRQHWQLGVEWPGGPDKVGARSNPINLSIRKQLAAVLPHGLLLAESKIETAIVLRQTRIGCLHRFDDAALHALDEHFVQPMTMEDHRTGRMVGMSAVYENVCERNPGRLFNLSRDRVQMLTSYH